VLSTPSARGGLSAVICVAAAACGTGSVDIVLDLPTPMDLAPAGASTVTLIAEAPGESPRATTSEIRDDGSFDLGKLPVADGLSLSVVLRSTTQRVVGYGRAEARVDIRARDPVEVDVPVRRPFAYVTGPTGAIAAMDTTLDSSQKDYQKMIQVGGGAQLVATAGRDVWVIDGSGHATRIAGATHQPDGATLNLPGGISDAVASSDGRWLVAGTGNGLAIADTKSSKVTNVGVPGGVDRVAIGLAPAGGLRAIGLSGQRTSTSCGGSSSSKIALVGLDPGAGPGQPAVQDAGSPLADIAASESTPAVVGADPCAETLVRLGLAGEINANQKLAAVPGATAVAMFGDRAWALGSVAGVVDPGGPSSMDDVTTKAANLVVVAVASSGDTPSRSDLAPIRQVVEGLDSDGQTIALSRDINAHTAAPIDIVVVPPGDQIALLYRADFHAPALSDGLKEVIPETTAHIAEYELLNATGGAVVQRVLVNCNLQYDNMGSVASWKCEPAAGADWPLVGGFEPGNLAVLYGGR
jgi:hypothetical protein